MSDYNLKTPCEDQNLSPDALKECQQKFQELQARKDAADKVRKAAAEEKRKQKDIASLKRFETKSEFFINASGVGSTEARSKKALERRKKNKENETSIINKYNEDNETNIKTLGGIIVEDIINSSNEYKYAFPDLYNIDSSTIDIDLKEDIQKKKQEIVGGFITDLDKIYNSRKDLNPQVNKGKTLGDRLDTDFLSLWKEQEGFDERLLRPGVGSGWGGKLSDKTKEESGYNKALKQWQQNNQNLSDDELQVQYGQEIFDAYKKDKDNIDVNLFGEKAIKDKIRAAQKRSAERLLGQTGERDVSSILMPALDKYLYTEEDKNEEGLLPNEAVLKYNEEEKRKFIEAGCGNNNVADGMPLGQTVECKGKKYTLKRFQDPEQMLEKYNEGTQQLSERSRALNNEIKESQKNSAPELKTVNDLKDQLENYGAVTTFSSNLSKQGYNDILKKYKLAIEDYNNSEAGKQLERLIVRADLLNEEYTVLEKQGEVMNDYGMILEAGMLNYNLLDKTIATLNAQFIAPIKALTGSIGHAANKLFDEDYSDVNLKSSLNYYKMATEKLGTEFAQSLGSEDFGKDGFKVGRYLLNLSADNSFSIAATLLPGGIIGNLGGKIISQGLAGAARKAALTTAQKMAQKATMATFFVSGSGDQWGKLSLAEIEAPKKLQEINDQLLSRDLTPEMEDALMSEKDFYESQLNLKYGISQRAFASILYGAMDMWGERLGSLRVISNLQKVGKSYSRQGLFNAWRKSAKAGITSTLQSGYRFGAGIGTELLEESFVNLGTAFVDKEILGINRGYLDDFSKDFALNTAFTSIALQGPYMSSNVMSGLRYELNTNADRRALRKTHGQLMGITAKLEEGKLNGNLTKKEIALLEADKQKLFEQSNVSDFVTMNNFTKLDANERQQLVDVASELRAAEKEYYNLTNDPQFGEEGFIQNVKDAEARINEIDAKKADILKSKKLGEYNQQEADLLKENKDAQLPGSIVAKGRVQIYEAALDIAGFQYDGTTDVLTDEASVDAFIEQNKDRLSKKDIEGIKNDSAFVDPTTGNLVINQRNIFNTIMTGTTSQALTAAIAPLHELMHAQIKATKLFDTKNNPELQQSIDTATTGLTDLIQTKIDNGSLTNERGKEILDRINQYDKNNIEEILTVFSESVILGDIKANDMNALYGLKNMLNGAWGQFNPSASNVLNPFTNTNDIYSFVSDFAEKTVAIQGDKVKQTFTIDSTGRTKFESGLIFSQGDIKSNLDTFVQNKDGSKKYESKEDFQKSEDFAQAFDKIENSNLLDGLIRQGVSQGYLDMNPDFVQEAKQRIGEKFMKEFDPTKNESLFGWLTGKTKGGQSIINFAKGDIQNIKKKEVSTTSIDDSTIQIADKQEIDTVKKEVTPLIEVMDFLKKSDPSFDTKKFEQDFTKALEANAKKEGINLADPNLTPKQRAKIVPYNVLAKAIGIDVKKLSDPNANLSKSESLKAQQILLAAKPFIKNVVLGKANTSVQTVASKKKGGKPVKVGGDTLGLGKNILKTFFGPSKRLGSGKNVRSPKQWSNERFDKAIGTKEGKVDPNYKPRDSESQVIKGLLKAVAEQMGGRATSRVLDKGPQTQDVKATQAALDSMKSPLMFSRANTKKKGIEKHGDNFIVLNNKNSDHMKIAENVIAEIFPQYLPVHDTGGIFSASNFANAGVKESSRLKGYQFFTSGKLAQVKRKAKKNEAKFTDKQRKDVKIAGSQKRSYWKNINKKGYDTKIKQNYDGLEFVLFQLNKMYKDAKGNTTITLDGKQKSIPNKAIVASVIASWMNNVSDSNYHFFRNAAIPKMLDPKLLKKDGSPDLYSSRSGKGKGRAEHNVMANDAVDKVFDGILDGNLDSVWPFLLDNYYQSLIPITDDGKMSVKNSYNFDDKIPPEVQKGFEEFIKTGDKSKIVPILAKYFHPKVNANNGGFNPNNFNFLGQILTAKYNVQVPQNLYNNAKVIALQQNLIWEQLIGNDVKTELQQFQKAIPQFEVNQKAEIKKENTLQNGIKFSKSPKGKKIIDKTKKSEGQDFSKDFNNIIQENKGIPSEARYSEIVARRKGRNKGKFRYFLPPGAEDFKGLIYNFLGKGKKGEQQFEFFEKNLINPYKQAVAQIERFRRALKNDYATLLKSSPNVRKKLGKKIKGTDFTHDNAIRAFLWNQSGMEIPGLSKRDQKKLIDAVQEDAELKSFAEGLQLISKQDTWVKPTAAWDVQTIQSDLHALTTGPGRKKFLENSGFIENADQIFSKDNLNKIEAAYGTNVREAIEDMMYRMETGMNRPSGMNRLTNNFNNWVNRSIGAIMFFNRKSALLQTISSMNFINWSDNNPLKAAMAFANQKQYWSDVVKIFNSPKLKERRAGLKGDINEAELANAVAGATNKAEAALSWLLKQGFLPTQMADSFAIATGGATFYRNRVNSLIKQGMNKEAAEIQAWKDFSKISEESQQSADPSMISEQQASVLGRLLLAFQNTPMQYTRLMKRAGQDLINGRGDAKTHISKIIYYGAIQNFMFSALQNALFTTIPGFADGDDEEEETKRERIKQNKNIRIASNMVDTVLRGTGIYGAIAATIKNTVLKYFENEKKDPFAKDNASILLEAVNLSPPIGSKIRKLNNALKTKEYEKDVISERGWEITRDGKVNLSPSYRVLGSTLEATLNLPLERTLAEIEALIEMTDQRNSSLERIALGLGWRTWDIGVRNEEHDQIKVEAKERKKQVRKDKVIKDREEKKRLAELRRFEGKTEKEIKLIKEKDSIIDTNKSDQIKSLTNLGLTKKEIKDLKYEEDRVDKILELTH